MVEFLSRDYIVHRMISPSGAQEENVTYGDVSTLKPKFAIRKERGRIVIQFSKPHPPHVKIFSKRGSEEKFNLLAEINESQYIDSRPNLFEAPEIREYMATFHEGDKTIGLPSDVVLIIHK